MIIIAHYDNFPTLKAIHMHQRDAGSVKYPLISNNQGGESVVLC